MKSATALAVDLGSSSGRVIAGTLRDGTVTETEVHRFPHEAGLVDGALSWDLDFIWQEIVAGLRAAVAQFPDAISVSVDTWGVDFVMLDAAGNRIENHRTYRDERTLRTHAAFQGRLSDAELWDLTGIAPSTINSANQLFAFIQEYPDQVAAVDSLLFLPDYFTYLLSGVRGWSRSIASTSALCRPGANEFCDEVFDRLAIPRSWVGEITPERTEAGLCSVPGLHQLRVVRAGAHDTACAVQALPRDRAAESYFLSCGSWSVLGVLRDDPLISRDALHLGLTNEARSDPGMRPLFNITGLWILQECQRQWRAGGKSHEITKLIDAAERIAPLDCHIDVDEPQFAQPGDMIGRIESALANQGVVLRTDDEARVMRVIMDSLARRYARGIEALGALTGSPARALNMFGGGSRNRLLTRLTANALGVPVIVGPSEASSLGSILTQLEILGELDSASRNDVIEASAHTRTVTP